MSGRQKAALSLTIAAVVLAQQLWVSPANFGGADEWLGLELTSRGILGVPYANRPLVFLWLWLAQGAWPDPLRAAWLFTSLAFWATGVLTALLVSKLLPSSRSLALVSGVLAAAWAPLDFLRLDTTLITGYAGFTSLALAAIVLFVESWARASRGLLLVAGGLALVGARGVEGVIPVVALAPLLVLTAAAPRSDQARRRSWVWTACWAVVILIASAMAAAPKLAGTASYQEQALGFDPSPVRVAARMLRLLGMHVAPLVTTPPHELGAPVVATAVPLFVIGAVATWLPAAGRARDEAPRQQALWAVGFGLALAVAAQLGLALTQSIVTPARAQVLSAPGVAMALTGSFALLAAIFPAGARSWVVVGLGAWTVAVGSGRVAAMQREWSAGGSMFEPQRRVLAGLVRQAPAFEPNTLLVLQQGSHVFPTTFAFRHGLALMYPGQAVGIVLGGHPFLYPWRRVADGIEVAPWPVIRRPWGVDVSYHRIDEVVIVRVLASGEVVIVQAWPEALLGALPAGRRYAPDRRVTSGPVPPRSRRLLERVP